MAQENFIRRYLMKAGKMGHNGFQIGQTSTENPHALHISFSIEKSTSETANTAKVQIWNLSPANLSILDTKDCVIELQAGYANHIALILAGNVVTSSTEMDGADRMTELEVVDGRVALRDTYVEISRSGRVDSKEVFDEIAGAMGVSVIYSKGCKFKVLPHGFSFVGPAKTALKKLCKTCGLSWSIQNSVLQIRKPNEPITTRACSVTVLVRLYLVISSVADRTKLPFLEDNLLDSVWKFIIPNPIQHNQHHEGFSLGVL